MKTVQVQYTCSACSLTDVTVNVPARVIDNVVHWLDHIVVPRLIADHSKRAPGCHPKAFKAIKIPLPRDGGIGSA